MRPRVTRWRRPSTPGTWAGWRNRGGHDTPKLCADDDSSTDGNPGLTKARDAAQTVGGLVAIPDFGEYRPSCLSDFNDLAIHRGLEAVAECIAVQVPAHDGDTGDTSDTSDTSMFCKYFLVSPGGKPRDTGDT
jgi:putative DNA primase/helicase